MGRRKKRGSKCISRSDEPSPPPAPVLEIPVLPAVVAEAAPQVETHCTTTAEKSSESTKKSKKKKKKNEASAALSKFLDENFKDLQDDIEKKKKEIDNLTSPVSKDMLKDLYTQWRTLQEGLLQKLKDHRILLEAQLGSAPEKEKDDIRVLRNELTKDIDERNTNISIT